MIEYTAILIPDAEEPGYTVIFPDAPGCITEGDTEADALVMAADALSAWLAAALKDNQAAPPTATVETEDMETGRLARTVRPARRVAVAAWLRFHRERRGWTQTETAKRLGVSQETYASYENPDGINPGWDTVERIETMLSEPIPAV